MGLSSSQARLLNLTGRMHQIEYKAAKLEADKLRMANESKRVYQEYQNALEQTKIQVAFVQSDGSIDYMDATYNNLVERGYDLRFEGEDKVRLTVSQANHYELAKEEGGREYFAALESVPPRASVSPDGYTEVFTSTQFSQALARGGKVRLMADIDMSKVEGGYTSKTPDEITLDGNGHTITNLTTALFGRLYGGVNNLKLEGNVNNSGGILANSMDCNETVSNVIVNGTIGGNGRGGLIGEVLNGNISNCEVHIDIDSGTKYVGGLVGIYHLGTIENCKVEGTVRGNQCIGGFIGHIGGTATIKNSSSLADVTSSFLESGQFGYESRSGGFIGGINSNSTVIIEHCSASGDVTVAGGQSGGFIGQIGTHNNLVLGENGTINNGVLVKDCSSSGELTFNKTDNISLLDDWDGQVGCCVGGFGGCIQSGTIQNCNTTGIVTNANPNYFQGNSYICTFAGTAQANANITGCYALTEGTFCTNQGGNTTSQTTNATQPNALPQVSPTTPNIRIVESVTGDKAERDKALFDEVMAKGYTTMDPEDPRIEHGDDNRWLTNMVNEGYLFIYKKDTKTNEYYQVSVSTDTNLQEVDDEKELRKAEAKYEADMRRIDMKDRKFDYDLAALDAERNAIKSEMETLKTVAKDNVDRTFRLFG